MYKLQHIPRVVSSEETRNLSNKNADIKSGKLFDEPWFKFWNRKFPPLKNSDGWWKALQIKAMSE